MNNLLYFVTHLDAFAEIILVILHAPNTVGRTFWWGQSVVFYFNSKEYTSE